MRFKEARKIAKQVIRKDLSSLHYWYEKGYDEYDNLSEQDKLDVNKQIDAILRQFEKLIKCHVCDNKGYYEVEDSMLVDTRECEYCK